MLECRIASDQNYQNNISSNELQKELCAGHCLSIFQFLHYLVLISLSPFKAPKEPTYHILKKSDIINHNTRQNDCVYFTSPSSRNDRNS